MIKKIIIFIFFIYGLELQAADFNRIGSSFRSQAMGNTGISSAHDNEALFYNPATLPNVQRSYFDILSLQVASSLRIQDISTTTEALQESREELYKFLEEDQQATKLGALAMTSFNYQAIDRGFNFAGLYAIELNQLFISNKDEQNTFTGNILMRYDQSTQVGFSYPFGLGEVVIAGGFKMVQRTQYNYNFTSILSDSFNPPDRESPRKLLSQGYDAGILLRLPGQWRFRAALGIINIGGLKFDDESYDSPQEINIGLSIGPTIGRWRTLIALDYRDISKDGAKVNDQVDNDTTKRTHFGVELGYFIENKTFALFNMRAGMNQGLLTYGAEMNFLLGRTISVGYTSFQENVGDFGQKNVAKTHVYYMSVGI